MTILSDLSLDLVEEILSRVAITSLRAVRSTCKQWSSLHKDESFTKKHCGKASEEILEIMIFDYRVCLRSINIQQHGLFNLSVKQIGELNHHVDLSRVFHCDGFLLCVTEDDRLVVWNPYLGHTRWIQFTNKSRIRNDLYVLGYNNNNHHKILRFWYGYNSSVGRLRPQYEIYDLKSNSWRVLDVARDGYIINNNGTSLKGNAYFVSRDDHDDEVVFLFSFDFTKESFGPRLPLPPLDSISKFQVTLSSVRGEKLAVLLYRPGGFEIEIWITAKAEPNAVSWSKFLMKTTVTSFDYYFFSVGSFFVDEEKKVAVVYSTYNSMITYYKAYITGEDGYYNKVDIGTPKCWCSYVPSSMSIQQGL